MLLKVTILSGIPASGKSTWSKNYLAEHPDTKRINRDDLRNMFDDGRYTDGNENFARSIRNELIHQILLARKSVLIDDTNCNLEQLVKLINIVKVFADGICTLEIEVVNFDIDFNLCRKRNKERLAPVDEKSLFYMQKNKNAIKYKKLEVDIITKITE